MRDLAGQADTAFRWLVLAIATVNAVIFPVARFSTLLSPTTLRDITIGTGAFLLVLFLRMLLDPKVGRAVKAANFEMQGGQMFKARRIGLLDPNWGLFGKRQGRGYLVVIRTIASAEFVVALVTLGGAHGLPMWLLLVIANCNLAVILTLIQLTNQFPEV